GRLHNPYRLYRDPEHGRVAGVCAGIANFFGIDPTLVRIGVVIALFFFIVPVGVTYLVAAAILPVKPPSLYANREEEAFWRGVSMEPDRTLHGLGEKFASLKQRLERMEAAMTSQDFELRRKFRDLDR